jgi:ABC-type uncharacterized transport system YnjBCD ATPase subunit
VAFQQAVSINVINAAMYDAMEIQHEGQRERVALLKVLVAKLNLLFLTAHVGSAKKENTKKYSYDEDADIFHYPLRKVKRL